MEKQEKVLIGEGGESLLAMADKLETMMKSITIARQVKGRLKELGWTNEMLAKSMGCSQHMVIKILKGDQNLTLKTISKLERVLGIKKIYL
ncbi:XRE family transcriptional regulator [bacterium]|nr:XRE family transcriptional regulator [bacterium]